MTGPSSSSEVSEVVGFILENVGYNSSCKPHLIKKERDAKWLWFTDHALRESTWSSDVCFHLEVHVFLMKSSFIRYLTNYFISSINTNEIAIPK